MKRIINMIGLAFLMVANVSMSNEYAKGFSPSNAEEQAEYQKLSEAFKNIPEKVKVTFQGLISHYAFLFTAINPWFTPSGRVPCDKAFIMGEFIKNGPNEEQIFITFKEQFINESNKDEYSDNAVKEHIHSVCTQLNKIPEWVAGYKGLYLAHYDAFMNELPSFNQPLKDKFFKSILCHFNFPIINLRISK